MIESAFEYDKDEIDRTVREIREEHFFKKEFAKDLKKFSKLQQATLNEGTADQPKKKSIK